MNKKFVEACDKEIASTRKEWASMEFRRPDGLILDFTIQVSLKEGEQVPSIEELKEATKKCIILDYSCPLPKNYSIN